MEDQTLGMILHWPIASVPEGWHLCDGTHLQIRDFQALFTVIGTRYGGDGHKTFALPDFRGRIPVGTGKGKVSEYAPGQTGGSETVTLTESNLPEHTHGTRSLPGNAHIHGTLTVALGAGDSPLPDEKKYLAGAYSPQLQNNGGLSGTYNFLPEPDDNMVTLGAVSVSIKDASSAVKVLTSGANVPHNNIQPFLVLNYIIAIDGLFPTLP